MATFDAMPCLAANMADVDANLMHKYLEDVMGKGLLESDERSIEEQLSAVGMFDTEHNCPTNAAIVLFGRKPRRFLPGLYVQYVRFKGEDVTSEVENEIQLDGNYCELLPRLESLLELSVIKKKPVFVSLLREEMVSNYPYKAIRELVLNACMHRDLQSNMPLRLYEFSNHLEITNAGGLYGNARPENFPTINDYRNPLIASAMKTMGYVNMFNRGVGQVQTDLKGNGNPAAEFVVNLITAFRVNVNEVASNIAKVATSDEKVASSSPKVATSERKVVSQNVDVATHTSITPLKKKMSAEEMAIYILEYCSTWRSVDEIAKFADRDKDYIRNKVLPKLAEKLEKEFPDVPNHPKQKYRTKKRKEM